MTPSASLARRSGALLCAACSLASWTAAQVPFKHVVVDDSGPQHIHTKTVGDLNGDGFVDLVVGGKSGEIYWYEDRSQAGTWTRHVVTSGSLGSWSTDAECADLDRDGDLDLVVSDKHNYVRIGWFENLGGGSAFTWHPIGGPWAHDIEVADFDLDGDVDIITRRQDGEGGVIELWRNDPGGNAWTHHTYNLPSLSYGEGLTHADLDGDGDPDVVMGRYWYENPGDPWSQGLIQHEYSPATTHLANLAFVADVNGDGRLDVITTPSEPAAGTGRTSWHRAPINPKSSAWTDMVLESGIETVTHSLAAGDVDLDGDVDVMTAEMHQGADPDEVRIYLNTDGVGGGWSKMVLYQGGSHGVRLIDAGGDGDLDLFGANWTTTQRVDLWENLLHAPRVGEPFCVDGAACPCGNGGWLGSGCLHSGSAGARLEGWGSTSVSADDLVLVTSHAPRKRLGRLIMGTGTTAIPAGDGLMCVAGTTWRFPVQYSGLSGSYRRGPGLVAYTSAHFAAGGAITSGSTWHFQTWFRDVGGPCGTYSNLSPALTVTFTP